MERATKTVMAGGLEWLVLSEFADVLPRLDLEAMRHPEQLPEGALVKQSTVRTVARLTHPHEPDGPALYVKRFRIRDLRDRLRHILVRTKPEVEWRVCRQLQARGIPTCDVLAIAVRCRLLVPHEGFLVSCEVPGTVTLQDFLAVSRPETRTELAAELGELTGRFVQAGFYHHDYHFGNLLVRPDAPAGQRLYVVDLHSVRVRPPGEAGALRMLAMLDYSTRAAGVTDAERDAFLRAFLSRWRGGPGLTADSMARWPRRIADVRRSLWRRHMASRTRRCMVRSSLFTPDRAGGYRIHRRRDFPVDAALAAVRSHEAALSGQASGCEILRNGRKTQVSLCPCASVPPFEGTRPADASAVVPGGVCVKAFRHDSFGHWLKELIRPRTRARRAWVAARGFSVRGIRAPRPLALLENRTRRPNYLITEAVTHRGSLHDLAVAGLPRGDWRRRLGVAIAGLLRRMADQEVYHPDTKPSNLLIEEVDGEIRPCLVDLDAVRFGPRDVRRTWVRNLAQLDAGLPVDVTVLDRMRCLRACGAGRWSAAERMAIARDVLRLSLGRGPAWRT